MQAAGRSLAFALALFAAASPIGIGRAAAQTGPSTFNVKSFGAVGDGVADDTPAIRQALQQLRAGGRGGLLYFPPGIFRTTGEFDVSGITGLQVAGAGVGTTTIRLAHATSDLFFWETDNAVDQTYRDFSVRSDTVARTGGWVLRGRAGPVVNTGALLRSRIRDIDVKDQVNGFLIAKYEFVWIDRVQMSTFVGSGGVGIKAGQRSAFPENNQGSELYIRGTSITGLDRSGRSFVLVPPRLAVGYMVEDADAVYISNSDATSTVQSGLLIVANAGGHAPSNLFFEGAVFDTTRDGPAAHVTGGGIAQEFTFTGCVFANAGRMAASGAQAGLVFDVANLGRMVITGGRIAGARGDGLRIEAAPARDKGLFAISGVQLDGNGGDGLRVSTGAGQLAPVITGVDEVGSGGAGLRTGAATRNVVVSGNRFVSGTVFGVTPGVAANNGF